MCPVRPQDSDFNNFICALCDDEDGFHNTSGASILAHVDQDENLIETDLVDLDEDTVTQPAHPLPQPKVPTAAQIQAHCLTHFAIQILVPTLCGGSWARHEAYGCQRQTEWDTTRHRC